ncbi:MAG: HAD family phosphatase [Lachnospiraceae bacterium]|nr:HAD family phosphatase [Lachnospiraceae bacterium]
MLKAVIFDMDGVIFDSERIICDLWMDFAKEKNMQGMEDVVIKCVGLNDAATERMFKDTYGEEYPYDEFKQVISQKYHELCDGGKLPMKPGVRELLEFLKEKGVKTALASSTKVQTVTDQLRDAGILDYYEVVIGGDMIKHSKPDPEIFIKAAGQLEIDITEAFIIEDSYNGIRAAHSAGAMPLMVPDLIEPNEEISALCHKIFKDLTEVRDYLAEI